MSEQENQQTEVEVEVEGGVNDRYNDVIERLEKMYKEVKTLLTDVKNLKKENEKTIKKMTGRKKTVKDPNTAKKAPSGFAKPTNISAELASFIGFPEGDLIARPAVTKKITEYIRTNNLQNENNKRIIEFNRPGGEALATLLRLNDHDFEKEPITFFNLQKYLKIHFSNTGVQEAVETEVETETVKEEVDKEVDGVSKIRRRKKVSVA